MAPPLSLIYINQRLFSVQLEREAVSGWLDVDKLDAASCEDFLAATCLARLGPGNHFTIKVKSHLVVLYGLRERRDGAHADRTVLERRLRLCQEVVKWVGIIGGRGSELRGRGRFLTCQRRG